MTSLQERFDPAVVDVRAVVELTPSHELVAVTELAARICDVPMASVNLITDTEQHLIATIGMDPSVCGRTDSMCHVALQQTTGPVVVPDAREDPRFCDNPFVTGVLGSIRFYASHPLRLASGQVVGTLCVFDEVPRAMRPEQAGALVTLAERVANFIDLELRTVELAVSLAREEQVRAELEESNRRLALLAGQVSHDLKTPLTSLTALLELLSEDLRRGPGPAETLPLVDRARRSAARMAVMIDHVLDFARLGGSLHLDDVDLDLVIDEVVLDLGDALEGVSLMVDALPVVRGDRVQLHAVLQNLLSNAAKYRARGRSPQVSVTATQTPAGWRVEVADNGPGVPAEDRALLFEPLTRGTTTVDGTGIGLATCLRIVEAHGGEIGLADTPGGGTTAWFSLL